MLSHNNSVIFPTIIIITVLLQQIDCSYYYILVDRRYYYNKLIVPFASTATTQRAFDGTTCFCYRPSGKVLALKKVRFLPLSFTVLLSP